MSELGKLILMTATFVLISASTFTADYDMNDKGHIVTCRLTVLLFANKIDPSKRLLEVTYDCSDLFEKSNQGNNNGQ